MPKLAISVNHNLVVDDAVVRVERWLRDLKESHGKAVQDTKVTWGGPTAQFSSRVHGFSVTGSVCVTA